MPNLDAPDLRDRAVRAARGEEPFDLLVAGGTLLDAATGELRRADVGLVGPLIASVHPPREAAAQARLDAAGGIVIPGLIDSHMHVESSMVTPRRYAEAVLAQGTTAICWDPHEIANVLGLPGVRWAAEATRGLPLEVNLLAPSCVPSAPGLERAGASFGGAELAEMLRWPEVTGVAEVMEMRGVLTRGARMRAVVGAGLASGKPVCGHARSLAGGDLQGFAAAGISSDHELTCGEDLLERLRAGMTVELRGSHDDVLPDLVAALRRLPGLPPTLTLCTDDVFPDDLLRAGGMIDVLRRLVRDGMPAIDAVRAATLHAALRLGRGDIGLVAPGRRADLAVLSDLARMEVREVIASGRHLAHAGALLAPLRPDPVALPPDSVHVAPLEPGDFVLHAPGPVARLRVVERPRFTRWGEVAAPVEGGAVALPEECILMAVIHRHGRAPAVPVLGVLRGWGRWRGALATTVSHDSHNLVVFGRDPADLAAAANAVIARQGGMAVAAGGAVRAVLALPVAGLISDAPLAAVARDFAAVRSAAAAVVEGWTPKLPVIKAAIGASLACNAGPHVTDLGIADGTTGEVFPGAVV